MDMKGIPHSEDNKSKGMVIGQARDDILEMTVSSPTKTGPKILKPRKWDKSN